MALEDVRATVEEFIKELIGAIQKKGLYGSGHDLTKAAIDTLYMKSQEAFSSRPEITIGIIGKEIAFEKEPFYEMSKNIPGFIEILQEMKIEKISFLKGIEKRELADFIEIFTKDAGLASERDAGKALKLKGIVNVVIGGIGSGSEDKNEAPAENLHAAVKDNFQEGMDYLKNTMDDLSNNRSIDIKAARFFVNKLVGNLLKNKNLLLILTNLKKRDDLTFVHSMNVSILALAQADALGMDKAHLPDIGVSALLHDTGKLSVEGSILKKGGKLDLEEMEKMHSHPVDGAKILLETPGLSPIVAISAFEHHIRYDMKGYPARLYGKKMNLASMIISIADVYDAIRNKRHYHEARAPEEVYNDMISMSGTYFNPILLEIFFKTVGIYPPGTLVELDNNEIGLVVRGSFLDIRRPQVEILYNGKGEKEEKPFVVSLLEKKPEAGGYKRTIIRSLVISDKYEIPSNYNPN